jgi:hypothetical protein
MHRPLNEPGSYRSVRGPRAWSVPRPRARGDARLVLTVLAGLFATVLVSSPAVVLANADETVARTPTGVGEGVAGIQPGRAGRAKAARTSGFSLFGNDVGGTRSAGADGWWSGKACAALALAVCGLIAVAARRRGPRSPVAAVEVVGRVSLSPKHAVYLLRVGRRVLVVGAGPQGPPALITELDDVPPDPPAQQPEAGS